MNQQSTEKYILLLAKEISEIYDMDYEKALEIVQASFVPKMLIDDDDTIF